MGVDRSHSMCQRARARGAQVTRAEANVLPFPDATFAGARADRVLQHVVDPRATLAEVVRVLRRRAVLVVADPDQDSLMIRVPGVRPSVLNRLTQLRRDLGYRNGRWISEAPSMLEQLGVDVTEVTTFTLTLDDPADAFGLPAWPTLWKQPGAFTDDEIAEWNAAIQRPDDFLYAVTFSVVAGRTRH